jgi:hypothetical protein
MMHGAPQLTSSRTAAGRAGIQWPYRESVRCGEVSRPRLSGRGDGETEVTP